MCNEYYRRRREADESRAIWQEFDQAPPVDEPESPGEVTEPEPTEELREAIATPER
jgi:hypothetical protein